MSLFEPAVNVSDVVVAELVECVPPPEPAPVPARPADPDTSPTSQAQDATIEHTGAGPPPKGTP